MASSNKRTDTIAGMFLEDFALSGLDAQVEAITHNPGFETLREQIWREGFESGYAKARQEADGQRQELVSGPVQHLSTLLAELARERARFLEQNMEELLQLAVALARRIVRVEAVENPKVLEERLRICLLQLEKESSYLIRVHPDRTEAVEALLAESGMEPLEEIPYRILGDRRVPVGSVILEGDSARLESICEDELQRLEEQLYKMHRSGEVPDDD